jgi:hypothetical protein
VDQAPVDPNSATLIASIGVGTALHPDFGADYDGGPFGIPYVVIDSTTPGVPVTFDYADESDPGPYPIPGNAPIEGGSASTGDRHVLVIDRDRWVLYELFAAYPDGRGWHAGSGAIFDLGSDGLRPAGWTSADAAGLPIFPGLARYEEVAAGAIDHALRFTAPSTCNGHIYPARHDASGKSCSTYPPMGLRVRLRASVDVSGFGPQARVVLSALKAYGMLLADNGSAWYVTGAPSGGWDDDDLHDLGQIKGADFEVVDTSGLVNG